MAGVDYVPEFQHEPWIDNVDVLSAAGDKGFNVRFKALEDEFRRISEAIARIGAALDELARAPSADTVTLTLAPAFLPHQGDEWSSSGGNASKWDGRSAAFGTMPVHLPDGAVIESFRAIGAKSEGNMSIRLRRQRITENPEFDSEDVASITNPTGRFDLSVTPIRASAEVDHSRFIYHIDASFTGATTSNLVQITALQITYVAE